MAKQWAIGAGTLFAAATIIRTVAIGQRWRPLVPGGIAVAVGECTYPPKICHLAKMNKECTMCHHSHWPGQSAVCLPGTGSINCIGRRHLSLFSLR